MMKQPKPNRQSIRLPSWDYRQTGFYFVTICTYQRHHLFDDPQLSEIAANAWQRIPNQPHAQHAALDEWVVMPNHIHGLIEVVHLPDTSEPQVDGKRSLQPGSLGAIIGNYKMLVTKRAKAMKRMLNTDMNVWQRGYWERIVRNDRELNEIRKYIQDNPLRWAEDRDNLDQVLERMTYIP
ncbi:MAG: transposase [Chloroflexota bacterium]